MIRSIGSLCAYGQTLLRLRFYGMGLDQDKFVITLDNIHRLYQDGYAHARSRFDRSIEAPSFVMVSG